MIPQSQRDGRGDPMTIESPLELEVTREKLAMLERRCQEMRAAAPLSYTQKLSLRSLCNLANQLKEQIARYESHHRVVDTR